MNLENRKKLFLDKISPEPNTGCWLWTAGNYRDNYGFFFLPEKKIYFAHRASYYFFKGEIPKDKIICHKCNTPECVNPQHLYAGSLSDNQNDIVKSGYHFWAKKTHCVNGHEFNKENTYVRTRKNGNINRKCKLCRKLYYQKTLL